MSNNEEFVLRPHMIQLFNENAERFNLPESEEKVFATEGVGRIREDWFNSGEEGEFPEFADTSVKLNKPLVVTEKIELPAMENPKCFFRFFSHGKLQMLFDACPEAMAKLRTRPWKYILMYSPEFVEQCPCLKEFSAEEKEQILHCQKHLSQYL